MAFRFPWTNFHELNLDWILEITKQFADLIPSMQEVDTNVQTALDTSAAANATAEQANDTAEQANATAEEAKEIATQAASAVIGDGAVTTDKLSDGAVTSAKIADGTIVAADIASNAVTSGKILDGAVTNTKILNGAVTLNKLGNDVNLPNIPGQIDASVKVISGTVETAQLADGAVTTAKIANGNVTNGKIADNAVTTPKLADTSVTRAKLASDANSMLVLLWSNPSPASNFAAQSIPLTLTPFKAILVEFNDSTQDLYAYGEVFIKGVSSVTHVLLNDTPGSTLITAIARRTLESSNTQVSFGDCYIRGNITSTTAPAVGNACCIPTAIYGIY